MAVKIKMLRERIIPVHNVIGKIRKTYKVNNEVGVELVFNGDAKYVDPELKARFEKKWLKPKSELEPESEEEKPSIIVETAAMEQSEKAILPRGRKKRK